VNELNKKETNQNISGKSKQKKLKKSKCPWPTYNW
jgi:hypothetical protein